VRRRVVPDGVQVTRSAGPFFFGAAEMFKDRVGRHRGEAQSSDPADAPRAGDRFDGAAALRDLVRRSRNEGTLVVLADVHAQPIVALERSGFLEEVGEENVVGNLRRCPEPCARTWASHPCRGRRFATPTVARETPPGDRCAFRG